MTTIEHWRHNMQLLIALQARSVPTVCYATSRTVFPETLKAPAKTQLTKFTATPRPKAEPHRAPKPAPRLPWRLRNLFALVKLAVKLALVRIAKWRTFKTSQPVKMTAKQRRRERRAAQFAQPSTAKAAMI